MLQFCSAEIVVHQLWLLAEFCFEKQTRLLNYLNFEQNDGAFRNFTNRNITVLKLEQLKMSPEFSSSLTLLLFVVSAPCTNRQPAVCEITFGSLTEILRYDLRDPGGVCAPCQPPGQLSTQRLIPGAVPGVPCCWYVASIPLLIQLNVLLGVCTCKDRGGSRCSGTSSAFQTTWWWAGSSGSCWPPLTLVNCFWFFSPPVRLFGRYITAGQAVVLQYYHPTTYEHIISRPLQGALQLGGRPQLWLYLSNTVCACCRGGWGGGCD